MNRFLLHPAFLFGFASAMAAFVIPGCGSAMFRGDNAPPEATSFQSNITADPVPVPAEIVSDLSGIPGQEPSVPLRAPLSKKVKGVTQTAAAASGAVATSDLEEADDAPEILGATNAKKGPKNVNVTYTVKHDDTLMKISFAAFGNVYRWREIYEANKEKIANPNALVKGTVLHISGSGVSITKNGNPYLIRWRDTLVKISDGLYGTPARWKNIWHNNPELIHNPNKIYAGFNLYYTWTEAERKEAELLKEQKMSAPLVSERKPAATAPVPSTTAASGYGPGPLRK